ncbi:MAG: ATP-binding protein [Candidatus Woesearchaeota archaeon]
MSKDLIKGQIVSGKFEEIIARQKSDSDFELGEILVAETDKEKFFLQVYDLKFGSQISQQNLELISGMFLEEDSKIDLIDKSMRNYKMAFLKPLLILRENSISLSKSLPEPFTNLREINADDMSFLIKPENPLFIGYLRSGSKKLDVPIFLDSKSVLTHHVLVSGTTGKGKSVLMKNLLWDLNGKAGLLVLDPHDEYYGRNDFGLKDNPDGNVVYYTSRNVPKNGRTLKINISVLRPNHFACLDFSDAQDQAMNAYYREYGEKWIESIIIDKPLVSVKFNDATVNVLKRRLMYLLDLDFYDSQVFCNGIFDINAGDSTIKNICNDLENLKTVIIDTSTFSGQIELLIGSLIATEVFNRYKYYKMNGILKDKPIIGVVLEEAPRVLGKEVLEKGGNIFSSIAREGRKFNVGLIAITQLPSLIPREILANMNTKLILGTEMLAERQALIESASQDLSSDSRNIAALDKGECIVSSNFSRFAIPVKIPFFNEKKVQKHIVGVENSFLGLKE